ncbi:MAG: cobaltochelatase subunit CobN [Candidatus Puniceispirillaceae bacterium]
MHLVFVEQHGLEETQTAIDLDQSPAELVVLSFSDSDLTAFAAAWHTAKSAEPDFPSLRLANLNQLTHPLSVDIYLEKTLRHAAAILIRLIGGVPYWSYGLAQLKMLADKHKIALAVLPADGRIDTQLDDYSTLPVSTLRRLSALCEGGGELSARAALAQLAMAGGLYAQPVRRARQIGNVGYWHPDFGVSCPVLPTPADEDKPHLAIIFYRSFALAADTAPIAALYARFCEMGYHVTACFVPSLKAPDAANWLQHQLDFCQPDVIVNATSFSGRRGDKPSVLELADVPVFQIALSTASEQLWADSSRGLSPADMAMHIVLPEVDGRIFAGVASFKQKTQPDTALQFSPVMHQPNLQQIDNIASKIDSWTNLARQQDSHHTDSNNKKIGRKPAIILSSYPGKPWQIAHAVGLDGLASAEAILADNGFTDRPEVPLANSLPEAQITWPVDAYLSALDRLPETLRQAVFGAWGEVDTDPHVWAGAFHFTAEWRGDALVAVQPERSEPKLKKDSYHDLARTPPHHYVAFYLWLSRHSGCDCMVHIGAHGTLEWLPGKAVALSGTCWPEVLAGQMAVIYPFIVNDPGEAAQAKRRISAVTIGHLPPPLVTAGTQEKFSRLEALLDEFSNADGLDPKRRDRLMTDIQDEAEQIGLAQDLGLDEACNEADSLQRIDQFVCDVKDSQFTSGLHIFGRSATIDIADIDGDENAHAERHGMARALAGKSVSAGPAGSPYRGRTDILPTGRNLFAVDPLSVPTKSAYAQGVKLADEFIRRHLQDHGEYPEKPVIDLWGSQSMRTAGEEFAMALHLLGVRPVWAEKTQRVDGFEILPTALLDRPRMDVTLRVSGLFRDIFPTLMSLFDAAIDALAKREETSDWNPFAGQLPDPRIFSPAPGHYGMAMDTALDDMGESGRQAAADAWLAASSWAFQGGEFNYNHQAISDRVASADSFIHLQDLAETDLLTARDYAAHEAGFMAANTLFGGSASAYHIDNIDPENPTARTLQEELARVVYARAANPEWISSMRPHGFRGAAEIAATLEHMASFANLTGMVGDHLFDQFFDQTLGNDEVTSFLRAENYDAYLAICDVFSALYDHNLWKSRRNTHIDRLQSLTQANTGEQVA